MKKRLLKKRIVAAINGRAKTGTEYFYSRTSNGDGLLITEYKLPEAARVACARQALQSGYAWYYGSHVAALYWLPSNGEPEEIFVFERRR